MDELYVIAKEKHSDIIGVCESWLTPEMPVEPYLLPGFHPPLRRDRNHKRGGGVLCYVRENIPTKVWNDLIDPEIEAVWVTLYPKMLPRSFSVVSVCVVYHPPGADNNKLTRYIYNCCDHIIQKYPRSGLIIMGDLNSYKPGPIQASYDFKQLVKDKTFLTKTLDKVLTNMHELYDRPEVLAPIGSLDRGHGVVCCSPNGRYSARACLSTHTVRDQRPCNRLRLGRAVAQFPWHQIYHLDSCEAKFDFFQHNMSTLINKHMPLKTVTRSTMDPPWITDRFRELVEQRNAAYRDHLASYGYLKKAVRKMARQLKARFYLQAMASLKSTDHGKWWQIAKKLTGKANKGDGALVSLAKSDCGGDLKELAGRINNFFISVSADLPALTDNDCPEIMNHDPQFFVEPDDVLHKLLKIDITKASGPDDIPSWLLRDLAGVIAQPLCSIYNASVKEGFVPRVWKAANVVCIPKKNPPTSIQSDLRPISLLPVIAKHLEYHVGRQIWDIVAPKLRQNQYGGVKGSSPVLALIDLLHGWHEAAANKQLVRIMLLDYKKAFDHVSHLLILKKLQKYGVPNNLLRWVWAYLKDRQQRVRINEQYSEWRHVSGGVPQGSWLGPVLFIIVIDDLDVDGANVLKFMDDTTVTEVVPHTSTSKMQNHLLQVEQWSKENDMILNPHKTKELVINFRRTANPPPVKTMDNQDIEQVSHSKLLGVTIQNDLKWTVHIDTTLVKASKRFHFLAALKRCKCSQRDLITYYVATIRSVVEYAAPVYHAGLTKQQSEEVESIQRRAMKLIFPEKSYGEALSESKLQPLDVRRRATCRDIFVRMQDSSHRLHKLLPEICHTNYNLRNKRRFSTSNMSTRRQCSEFINYCLNNFNSTLIV